MYLIETKHDWLKTTQQTQTKEPQSEIGSLKFSDLKVSMKTNQSHWCYGDRTGSMSFILRKIK